MDKKVYDINNEFADVKEQPQIENILTEGYELRFKRVLVPWRYLQNTRVEDHAVVCHFEEKAEVIEELRENYISIAPIYHIKNSICRKCGKSYIDCDCVKFIDDKSE